MVQKYVLNLLTVFLQDNYPKIGHSLPIIPLPCDVPRHFERIEYCHLIQAFQASSSGLPQVFGIVMQPQLMYAPGTALGCPSLFKRLLLPVNLVFSKWDLPTLEATSSKSPRDPCYTAVTTLQPCSPQHQPHTLAWVARALFAILGHCPPPRKGRLGLDYLGVPYLKECIRDSVKNFFSTFRGTRLESSSLMPKCVSGYCYGNSVLLLVSSFSRQKGSIDVVRPLF